MNFSSINWGSVADWFSGIGSLSAVITALYLAKASQRIRITGFCGHRVIVGGNKKNQDIVAISATNIGNRSTVVNNIGVRTGLFKKRYAMITITSNDYSDGIPKQLNDGDQGYWSISLDEKYTWLNELCKNFILSKIDVWTMMLQIYTTNGGVINIRPEENLRQMIMDLLKHENG